MLVKATKVFSSCILVRNVFSEEITTRNLEDRRLSQAAIGFYSITLGSITFQGFAM